MSNLEKHAFPLEYTEQSHGLTIHHIAEGLTKREHAAILLRVPDSGDEVIDAMIRKANRMEFAKAAMQGALSDSETLDRIFEKFGAERGYIELAICSAKQADALQAELEKGAK